MYVLASHNTLDIEWCESDRIVQCVHKCISSNFQAYQCVPLIFKPLPVSKDPGFNIPKPSNMLWQVHGLLQLKSHLTITLLFCKGPPNFSRIFIYELNCCNFLVFTTTPHPHRHSGERVETRKPLTSAKRHCCVHFVRAPAAECIWKNFHTYCGS